MKKLLLLLSLNLWPNINADAQCNFYANFYNYPKLFQMNNLLPAPLSNEYFAIANYFPYLYSSICKLDINGDTIWSKQYCGNYFTELKYSLDSNLVSVQEFNPFCGATIGFSDIAFYKFDLNGDTILTSRFGTVGIDSNPILAILGDSTYLVVTLNNVGQHNLYHLDSAGDVIGTGMMPFENVFDVKQGLDGSIYYCGYLSDGIPDSYVIGKTNASLDTINWIKTYGINGGNTGDCFNSMFFYSDSDILVAGREGIYKINFQTGDSIWHKQYYDANEIYYLSEGTLLLVSSYYLTKVKLNGDTIWFKHLGINNQNWLIINSLVELSNKCFATLGSKYTYPNNYYPFFAYFDSSFNFPLNVGFDDLLQVNEAIVYPNPVISQSTLRFANDLQQPVDFILYDITGKIIEQQQTNNAEFLISKNNRSGLFIYELSFSNGFKQRGKLMFVD